ncbi:hypothetical protein XA68_10923 [Ophiocordyceps unilateralis]|uniref:Uncharacterized protein n=1 Tax=Ophiocordyceps unilateralis TaxID=268505 RepID=A0A2A9PGH9_OPHUN|nr:hypothetical protein XA68_10923 [Ophiocordyceps unilateralis]
MSHFAVYILSSLTKRLLDDFSSRHEMMTPDSPAAPGTVTSGRRIKLSPVFSTRTTDSLRGRNDLQIDSRQSGRALYLLPSLVRRDKHESIELTSTNLIPDL